MSRRAPRPLLRFPHLAVIALALAAAFAPIPAPIAPFVPPGDLDETQRVRMPSIGRPVAASVTDRVRMAPSDDTEPGSDSAIPFPEAELPADVEAADGDLEPSGKPLDEPAISPRNPPNNIAI